MMIYPLYAAALDSSETIQHLTGNGLFGVFILLLLIVGMEKWVSYQAQKDRLKAEQARMDKNEKELVESRKTESASRDRLSDALNNVAEATAINSEKIDQVQQDLQVIGDRVTEHTSKLAQHDSAIDELRKG